VVTCSLRLSRLDPLFEFPDGSDLDTTCRAYCIDAIVVEGLGLCGGTHIPGFGLGGQTLLTTLHPGFTVERLRMAFALSYGFFLRTCNCQGANAERLFRISLKNVRNHLH